MAYVIDTESQGRGAPHGHGLVHTDISPQMLRGNINNREIMIDLMRRVYSQITAFWNKSTVNEELDSIFSLSCKNCPLPGTPGFDHRVETILKTVNDTNIVQLPTKVLKEDINAG